MASRFKERSCEQHRRSPRNRLIGHPVGADHLARNPKEKHTTPDSHDNIQVFSDPTLGQILAPPSNYPSRFKLFGPNPWNKSCEGKYCDGNWV